MIKYDSSQEHMDGLICNQLYKQTQKKKKNARLPYSMLKKAFDEIQYSFMLKVLKRWVLQSPYLNIIKAVYSKPTASI